MLEMIVIFACLALMIIGSYTDLERREVPDWLNYSMIFFGIMIAGIRSILSWNYEPIIYSGFGLLAGFLVGALMFYTGQWGGGDSKMLMALGSLMGIDYHFNEVPIFVLFIAYTFIFGAVYGMSWSLGLAIINKKRFIKSWKNISGVRMVKIMKVAALILSSLMIIVFFTFDDVYIRILAIMIAVMSLLMVTAFVFVKSVEKSCMLKEVRPDQLTEGDWIAKDVSYKGKRITGPKDLGISKDNIKKLITLQHQGKLKKVLIKNGIPFVPSFLIAFIVLLLFGNIFMILV